MEKKIVVIDADHKQRREVCTMLEELNWPATPIHRLGDLQRLLENDACRLIFVDLETLTADRKLFHKLKRTKPSVHIMGLSSRFFHPELKEFMSRRIYACLNKPVDQEELSFWMKSLT